MKIPITQYRHIEKHEKIIVGGDNIEFANINYKYFLMHALHLTEQDADLHVKLYPLTMGQNKLYSNEYTTV